MLIRSKLLIAFGAISVLAFGAGAIAVLINSKVQADVAQIIQASVKKPKAAEGMSASLLNIGLHWQELLAQREPTPVEEISGGHTAEALKKDVEHFEHNLLNCHNATARGVQLAAAEGKADEIEAAKHEAVLLEKIGEKFAQMKVLLEQQMAMADTLQGSSGATVLAVWKRQYEEVGTLVETYKIGAENQLSSEVSDVEESLSQASNILLWSTLAILMVAGLLAWFMARAFSRPLNLLAIAARRIGEGQLNTAIAFESKDEFGLLATAFSSMAQMRKQAEIELGAARDNLEKRVTERTLELENIHKQLVEASRRGGMAEIATNVLHNVGNVLNSVNISTSLIVESVKQSKAASLARVVALLQEHADDLGEFVTNDARGKHIPAHLAQLSERLIADQELIAGELDSLQRNIEHIKEIVAMQQSYATFGGAKEMINVVNLVEDSLRMNEGALIRHRVKIVREFETVPLMNLEKHKILQILVNLVRNAKYACDESMRADRRLTVRVANGDGCVNISVIDNGVGILPENLERIFNHGFTTRKGGHGFGLHGGALAAKDMGGSLTVQSEGLGKGAAFTLELRQILPARITALPVLPNLELPSPALEVAHA